MMITDDLNLVAELKLYIKEHYRLLSFAGLAIGILGTEKDSISKKTEGIREKNFSEVSDKMSDYIKEERNYTSFAFLLDMLRKEKGFRPSELYKAAWIDKRLYSKIMATANYRPAKNTAITFGLALKLKPDEFVSFLQNAGFALSDSSIFDLVIRFCVEREIFDLHDVNALLLQADQKTLAKEAA
jgi:hypothetical protein